MFYNLVVTAWPGRGEEDREKTEEGEEEQTEESARNGKGQDRIRQEEGNISL